MVFVAGRKQTRNSNIEIRNKFEYSMPKISTKFSQAMVSLVAFRLEHWRILI